MSSLIALPDESGHDGTASEDMAARSGTVGPPSTALPKCFCNWRFCRTYQKAFREFKHPFYNGVIKLKFYENDPRSMALKESIDRTLNVESTKRNDWKEAATSGPSSNAHGTSNKYCRYYVARHHFSEKLMRHYLNDRRSWDWNKPLTEDEAHQFLYSVDPQDIYDDGENNGENLYVQTPNVPKDHVRELLKKLKDLRTDSQRNNGTESSPATPSTMSNRVPLASQDEHAPNINRNNGGNGSPAPAMNMSSIQSEHVLSSHSRLSTSTKNSNQNKMQKRNGNSSTSTHKTAKSTVTKNEEIVIESDDYGDSDEEEYGDDNDLDDTNRYSGTSRSRNNGKGKDKQQKEDDSTASSTVALLAQKEEENHRLREDLNDCKNKINMLQNIVEQLQLKVRLDLDDPEGDNASPAVNGENSSERKSRDSKSTKKFKNTSAKLNTRKKVRESFSSSGDDEDDVYLSDVKRQEAAESSLEHDNREDSSEEETSRSYRYNAGHPGDFGGARRQNGNERSRHNRQSLRRGSIHSRRSIHGGNSIVSRSRHHSRRGSMRGSADDGASVISRQSLQSVSVSIKSLPREIELMDDEDEDDTRGNKDDSSYFDDTRSVGSRSAASRVSGRSFGPARRTRTRKSQIQRGTNPAASRQRRGRSGRGAVPQEIDLSGDELDNLDGVTHENASTDTLFVREKQIVDPYGERGVYTGALSRSTCMPNGQGRLEYEKESRWYEGDWIHGRWTGFGKLSNGDGDFYEGGLKNDHKHGTGIMRFADGRVFEGEYIRGQMIQGKMTYQDGSIYGGSWVDGMRHGRGKCIFVDGSQYEGDFREGNFHGHGKMTWNDGGWYIGNWSNGEMDGRGKEVRPDGSLRHDGEWSGGQPIRSVSDTRRRRQQQQITATNGDELS